MLFLVQACILIAKVSGQGCGFWSSELAWGLQSPSTRNIRNPTTPKPQEHLALKRFFQSGKLKSHILICVTLEPQYDKSYSQEPPRELSAIINMSMKKGTLKNNTCGWLSKLWSVFGYPKYYVPYYNKGTLIFTTTHVLFLRAPISGPRQKPLNPKPKARAFQRALRSEQRSASMGTMLSSESRFKRLGSVGLGQD